jgi:hypothetical protein
LRLHHWLPLVNHLLYSAVQLLLQVPYSRCCSSWQALQAPNCVCSSSEGLQHLRSSSTTAAAELHNPLCCADGTPQQLQLECVAAELRVVWLTRQQLEELDARQLLLLLVDAA